MLRLSKLKLCSHMTENKHKRCNNNKYIAAIIVSGRKLYKLLSKFKSTSKILLKKPPRYATPPSNANPLKECFTDRELLLNDARKFGARELQSNFGVIGFRTDEKYCFWGNYLCGQVSASFEVLNAINVINSSNFKSLKA